MSRTMPMLLVFLLALVLTTTPARATDCMSALSNLFPCKSFLANPSPFVPEAQCCEAAKNLIDLADAESLCQCFRPLGPTILPSKAQMLPGLCNLNSFSPLLKCLAPSLDAGSGGLLPPLPSFPLPPFPFPPFPFVPLPPLPKFPLPPFPFVPLPPLPKFPLPPLPFVPPVANSEQQNKVQARDVSRNVILPPLPFPLPPLPDLPLPPLPSIPLPPLPKFPLPPLPFVPPVEKNL